MGWYLFGKEFLRNEEIQDDWVWLSRRVNDFSCKQTHYTVSHFNEPYRKTAYKDVSKLFDLLGKLLTLLKQYGYRLINKIQSLI